MTLTTPTPSIATDDVAALVGLYVTASSTRKARHGVVLPPNPGSKKLRLALDDRRDVIPLDPNWHVIPHHSLTRAKKSREILAITQRVGGRPSYRFGDLPAHLLATKTMLRREHRRQPAAGQTVIAYYLAGDEWAPLYAIADTAVMPPLSKNRTEAWTAARTCIGCSQVFPRPLGKSPDGDRYCPPCELDAAGARWIEQCRPVQQEMAAWAAAVLADPRTILGARNTIQGLDWYRIETIDHEVIIDAKVREFEDVSQAREPAKYAGTVHRRDLRDEVQRIAGSRIITWHGMELGSLGMATFPHSVRTIGDERDNLGERYSLWTGLSPVHRTSFWYPQPKLPWNLTSSMHNAQRTATSPAAAINLMRGCLQRMANEPAPEPTIRKPGA